MRSLRYLNSMLTVIAVLLTLNVYAMWSMTPAGNILSATTQVRAEGGGIPDPGKQRNDILAELKNVTREVTSLNKTMTDGSARIRLESGSNK